MALALLLEDRPDLVGQRLVFVTPAVAHAEPFLLR
jgi:hypothetical protein